MAFGRTSTAADVAAGYDLHDENVIVTGGTSGLGLETARALAGAGAAVVVTGRNRGRGEAAVAWLRETTGSKAIEFAVADLGSLASVRAFAGWFLRKERPLHLLINNAGIMAVPFVYTEDGFESQFGVNHLGHHALTAALLPALRAAGTARVVCLSSRAHRRGDVDFNDPNFLNRPYDPWQSYGQSKTANALFAVALSLRHQAEGITANAVMPGAVGTGMQQHLSRAELLGLGWVEAEGRMVPGPGWKTVQEGAATTIWAAVASELDGVGGRYLEDCTIAQPWIEEGAPPNGYYLPYALDPGRAQQLWKLSEKLVQGH